jgi:HSP20 family protein
MSMRDLIPWGRQENRAPAIYEDRRDPFTTLRREMDRLFDDTFRSFGLTSSGFGRGVSWPSVEVSETESEVRITAEVPGLAEKDIELTLDNGVLTLRGERKAETEDKDRGYSERFYGRFERRIALPSSVEEEKANARFDNGVLTVTLSKSPELARGRRIPINGQTKH